MIYEWGSRRHRVDAQVVGETVERLADANGGVCPPAALVDDARPDTSPIHELFEWDDHRAAESHRRHQARRVINVLVVTDTDRDDTQRPAFIHVKTLDPDGLREGYQQFHDVVADDGLRDQAIAEALRYLNGFRRRYNHLTALGPVFDAIDRVEATQTV